MDKTEKAIESFTSMLEKFVVKYGADTTDTVIEAARISAINNIVGGFVDLLWGCAFAAVVFYFAWPKMIAAHKKEDNWDALVPAPVGWGVLVGLCLLLGFIGLSSGAGEIINVWNWTGIFEPKIFLAHKVLGI